MLKEQITKLKNEPNQENFFELLARLQDSTVWIPCTAVMGEEDQKALEKMVKASDDPQDMVGQEFTSSGAIRLVPDILQDSEGHFFFPVFTSPSEMGEYGDHFSKIEKHFLEALGLAANNAKNVAGIVFNAFTDPYVLDRQLFGLVEDMHQDGSRRMFVGAVLGLAVADAIGVPYEFRQRKDIARDPANDMTGYGTHGQPAGTWSDDTSMTLALIDALTKSGAEPNYGLLADNFAAWLDRAEFTAHGEVFDVGGTCLRAIGKHVRQPELEPWECGDKSPEACGNGGLMRILPMVFWLCAKYGGRFIDVPEAREELRKVTAVTHANACCCLANLIYVCFAGMLFCRMAPADAWEYTTGKIREIAAADPWLKTALPLFGRLLSEDFLKTPAKKLSGSGYVVHTLESAVWCLMSTADYRSCVLAAVNLGEDTDTTAAVAGGLAGLYYAGSDKGIPESWLAALAKRDEILAMCEGLWESMVSKQW